METKIPSLCSIIRSVGTRFEAVQVHTWLIAGGGETGGLWGLGVGQAAGRGGREGHSSRSCTYELRRAGQNVECAQACESQLISSSLQVCLLEICHVFVCEGDG